MKALKGYKVENMSGSTGREVPNQFEITTPQGYLFQSYSSIIVFIKFRKGKAPQIYLDKQTWDYSVTTGKYRNQFLGEDKKTTEAKIKSGEYKLADLN